MTGRGGTRWQLWQPRGRQTLLCVDGKWLRVTLHASEQVARERRGASDLSALQTVAPGDGLPRKQAGHTDTEQQRSDQQFDQPEPGLYPPHATAACGQSPQPRTSLARPTTFMTTLQEIRRG